MARKSLSSQVIEELDRGRGLLNSVQDSVDPIIGHLLGAVLESMNRIETMCLAARQSDVNAVLRDPGVLVPVSVDETASKAAPARPKRTAPTRVKGGRAT